MTPERWARVEGLLEEGWSPEQVAGRLRLEGGWTVGRQWTSEHVRADRKHPCLESSPDPAFFQFFPPLPVRSATLAIFPARAGKMAGRRDFRPPGAGDSLSVPDGRKRLKRNVAHSP